MGISRACASTWVSRYRRYGEVGLQERFSVPHRSPRAASGEVVATIEAWRREHTWSASRITAELAACGVVLNRRTVTRHLARLGLARRRFIDPTGVANRAPGRIVARWPGPMVHLDGTKVGRIPEGGGWRVHGHWEGDLVTGAKNSHLATLVERHSRYVLLVRVPGKDTTSVVSCLSSQIQRLPEQLRRSLTWDRGTELAEHARFTVATDVAVYFCDPQSPWQRGFNENTNGLLRQYLPKGTDLSSYTQADLDAVALKLNTRPRKTLGYRTPADTLNEAVAPTS